MVINYIIELFLKKKIQNHTPKCTFAKIDLPSTRRRSENNTQMVNGEFKNRLPTRVYGGRFAHNPSLLAGSASTRLTERFLIDFNEFIWLPDTVCDGFERCLNSKRDTRAGTFSVNLTPKPPLLWIVIVEHTCWVHLRPGYARSTSATILDRRHATAFDGKWNNLDSLKYFFGKEPKYHVCMSRDV